MIGRILNLFGLQKIPQQKSLKDIQIEECEHEWQKIGDSFYVPNRGVLSSVYCPKCDHRRRIRAEDADDLIEMSKLRKKYLESREYDALDERVKQIEMEMKNR